MRDSRFCRQAYRCKKVLLVAIHFLLLCHICLCQDIVHVKRRIPTTPAFAQLGQNPCFYGPPPDLLTLQEAVARALCTNPKSREAWINIRIQAASLGIALTAYLPTLSGTWQETYESTSTRIPTYPQYDSAFSVVSGSGSGNLNWTLFDFGGRKATVLGATAMLKAAEFTAGSTLQEVFATTAGHYLALQSAIAVQEAARQDEDLTSESLLITKARVEHGAAPISDSLQAETAYLQAVVSRQEADGAITSAQGSLAFDIGIRPDQELTVNKITMPAPAILQPLEETASALLDQTMKQQPAIAAAREQLTAAQAKISQVRAAGLPAFSLIGRVSQTKQPASISLGVPPFLSTVKDSYIGFQVNIPIFEGFSRGYQIQQARAQAALQQEQVSEAERQAELDTWSALQAERIALKSVVNLKALLEVALKSYAVAGERYRLGVGSINDLLAAQTAVEKAREQTAKSVSTWESSRFTLSAKVGRLKFEEWKSSNQP